VIAAQRLVVPLAATWCGSAAWYASSGYGVGITAWTIFEGALSLFPVSTAVE
jgi:hypothetical protein